MPLEPAAPQLPPETSTAFAREQQNVMFPLLDVALARSHLWSQAASQGDSHKQYLEGMVWRAWEQQGLWDHHSSLQATQRPAGPLCGMPV